MEAKNEFRFVQAGAHGSPEGARSSGESLDPLYGEELQVNQPLKSRLPARDDARRPRREPYKMGPIPVGEPRPDSTLSRLVAEPTGAVHQLGEAHHLAEARRRVEVSISHDASGKRIVSLEDLSYGPGVGWYVQKTIRLDPEQVDALLRSLCCARQASPCGGSACRSEQAAQILHIARGDAS